MKQLLLTLILAVIAPITIAQESIWDKPTPVLAKQPEMTVFRSPACGCCGKWIDHMKKHGFLIKDIKTQDMETIKRKMGVPKELESCHTAQIDGYVIEGHVPAGDVKKLLDTKPKLLGLAAPGMPAGSPGMEMGGKKDRFSIMAFDREGNSFKFNEYLDY